jgi:phosphoglycerate dehydrogenase-like enzyme
MLNAAAYAKMKPKVLIVNCFEKLLWKRSTRGAESGRKHAALDVFGEEPPRRSTRFEASVDYGHRI